MAERFRASSAARHMQCPGSANLELAIPGWVPPIDDPTADTAANRGSELHAKFASLMDLTVKDSKNFIVALEYVTEIRNRRRFKVLVEEPLKAEWLVVGAPTVTADLVLFLSDEIHVFDLKTGGIPVEVTNNKQLMFYAVTYAPLAPRAKGVHLHIVQPWADNCESWFASTEVLADFMVEAGRTHTLIRKGDTTLSPGDDCTFCPANPHGRGAKGSPLCPVMMELLYPETPIDVDKLLEEE